MHQLPSKFFFFFSFVLMIEKNLFAPRMPGNLTLPYLTCQLARSTRRGERHGRGQGREEGREGIVRISTTMMMKMMKMIFCSDFCCIVSHNGKKKSKSNSLLWSSSSFYIPCLKSGRFVREVYYSGIYIPDLLLPMFSTTDWLAG